MIASAYNDPETIVGAIFGTGCNGAYMENVGSIKKLDSNLSADTPMAINCEYGAFDNAHKVLPRTKYDIQIDEQSPKPGEQAFEKMSAGLYLGEIYRLVVVGLYDRNMIFVGQDASKLREPYVLDTGFLSTIENDMSSAMSETRKAFKATLGIEVSAEELIFSQRLAEAIAVRGSRLCACGITAICRKKGIKSGHVAADGSVANKHPTFKKRWAQAMGEVLDWPEDRQGDPISITSAEDGSGVGAAVISAMTLRRKKEGNLAGIKET
jgi:hexokinase